MRFAFVTTEFPTTKPNAGGLATYVARMSRLLAEAGHEVEIFVSCPGNAESLRVHGCLVRHVPTVSGLIWRLATGVLRNTGFAHIGMKRTWLSHARALAAAVEQAHAQTPFDIVHSADHRGIGLLIDKRPERLLVVRCSAAMDLYMAADGRTDRSANVQSALEAETVYRADLAFAPSAFTARHYSAKLGRKVEVLRPPAYLEVEPAPAPGWLPQRYLLHFAGHLMRRKGTELIAEALKMALVEEPTLTMIWVGRIEFSALNALLAPLGDRAGQVMALYPQSKPALYALIRSATGVVLPSQVDNLPNTVIESLMLGSPVIGSDSSSIEELVEPGKTGILIENGSVQALSQAMVEAWRGRLPQMEGEAWLKSEIAQAFRPEAALNAYLALIADHQPKGTTT
jgi:glycosyltransferase involved in cell wall biosynthesis